MELRVALMHCNPWLLVFILKEAHSDFLAGLRRPLLLFQDWVVSCQGTSICIQKVMR